MIDDLPCVVVEGCTSITSDSARIAALESELAALRAANGVMREALVAMMEGSHWEEEHDYEGLRMPANWHTIRMPSSEALDKARAALNR